MEKRRRRRLIRPSAKTMLAYMFLRPQIESMQNNQIKKNHVIRQRKNCEKNVCKFTILLECMYKHGLKSNLIA